MIINTVDNGGLRIPEIETLVKAQKAAWIKRIVNNPQTAWLQYLYQSLPPMSIADLIKCSVKPEDLASNIPNFYRQILHAWYELKKEPESATGIRREVIWFNNNIKINNECIFEKELYDQGVISINDLLEDNGCFMEFHSFKNRYNVKIKQLRYMGIIDAIPSAWRQK